MRDCTVYRRGPLYVVYFPLWSIPPQSQFGSFSRATGPLTLHSKYIILENVMKVITKKVRMRGKEIAI